MSKHSILNFVSAMFVAVTLMSLTSSIYAQNDNKVVVVPLLGGDEAIRYTGNAPISVDQETNTISFDTSSLVVTALPSTNSQPSLVVNCLIALQGLFPSRSSEPFLGDIKYVGFNFAQRGWAQCDGQLLPVSQNSALFSLLGTIYGGDGRTSFALPDMRGRVAVHRGAGPGLTNRQQGSKYGAESTLIQISTP